MRVARTFEYASAPFQPITPATSVGCVSSQNQLRLENSGGFRSQVPSNASGVLFCVGGTAGGFSVYFDGGDGRWARSGPGSMGPAGGARADGNLTSICLRSFFPPVEFGGNVSLLENNPGGLSKWKLSLFEQIVLVLILSMFLAQNGIIQKKSAQGSPGY